MSPFKKCQIFLRKSIRLKISKLFIFLLLNLNVFSEAFQAESLKRALELSQSILNSIKNNNLIKNEYLKNTINKTNSRCHEALLAFVKAKTLQQVLTKDSKSDLEIESLISIYIINNQEAVEQFIKFYIYPDSEKSKLKKFILIPLISLGIALSATVYKKFVHDKNAENFLNDINEKSLQKNAQLKSDLQEESIQMNKTLNKKIKNLENTLEKNNLNSKYEQTASKILQEINDLKNAIKEIEEKYEWTEQKTINCLGGIHQAQGLGEENRKNNNILQRKINGLEHSILTLAGQIDFSEKTSFDAIKNLRISFEKLQNEMKEPQTPNFLDQPYLDDKIDEIQKKVLELETKTETSITQTNDRVTKLRDVTKRINDVVSKCTNPTKTVRFKNKEASESILEKL